jgi:hypothetical protein
MLTLKHASKSRLSCQWSDDDYDVTHAFGITRHDAPLGLAWRLMALSV